MTLPVTLRHKLYHSFDGNVVGVIRQTLLQLRESPSSLLVFARSCLFRMYPYKIYQRIFLSL